MVKLLTHKLRERVSFSAVLGTLGVLVVVIPPTRNATFRAVNVPTVESVSRIAADTVSKMLGEHVLTDVVWHDSVAAQLRAIREGQTLGNRMLKCHTLAVPTPKCDSLFSEVQP